MKLMKFVTFGNKPKVDPYMKARGIISDGLKRKGVEDSIVKCFLSKIHPNKDKITPSLAKKIVSEFEKIAKNETRKNNLVGIETILEKVLDVALPDARPKAEIRNLMPMTGR